MDEGFVVDVTRDSEVWNQAVQGFDVKEIEEKGPSEGSAEGTVKEVIVETKMHYIVEIEQAWNKIAPSNQIATKTYRYKLELDKDGKILGGEWISLDRPDFIWKNGRSEFKGLFEDLGKIYKKSVAYKKTETTDAIKNLEDRIKKFEEEKKNVEEKLKADSKKLAEEKEELEEQKNLIKVEKEKINKELLDEKKKLNEKISSNKEKLQIELDKLDAQIKSNAETFATEIKKIEEQKETISVKASQLEVDRKAFEESKKKMSLEMKSLKKAQKELDDKKKKFQAEKEAQVKKMANQRSKMTLLRKKLGETSAKLRKEKAKLAQEIKKFEGQKNQGIIKDLIKDLRPQLEKQRKAVSVALVILTNAKKKSSATLKAYKVLRGGLFNRNFKRLKKLYKSAMMDQKVKQTALDGEKAKLKNLKIELRDAVNRLRVLSVS
jgi:DNA repair exonuclease SbcCD ATPase subunit